MTRIVFLIRDRFPGIPPQWRTGPELPLSGNETVLYPYAAGYAGNCQPGATGARAPVIKKTVCPLFFAVLFFWYLKSV
jgi:hypothetical protein